MPGRLVGGERPAVPHVGRHPLRRDDERRRRSHSSRSPAASAETTVPGTVRAGRGHVDHPVAGIEAAEPAGAGVEPFLERRVQRPGADRAAVRRG